MKYTTLAINHSGCFSVPKVVRVLGACLGLLLFCSPVFAQLNYGRILGGVTDQSGGAVPTSFGVTQATSNSNNPVVGEAGARQIQFGLKLIF